MSWPYAHLLINHFPVVLSVCALGATILALLLKRRGLWQAAMGALTIAGAMIYPVHLSGSKADHALRNPWFIRPDAIETHDDAARVAMIVILIVGVFAAYSWWQSVKRPTDALPAWMRAGVLAGSIGAVATVTYTAYLGGKIIHEAPVLELETPPAGLPAGVVADSAARDSNRE
jgi:uncharacterized membrane protein